MVNLNKERLKSKRLLPKLALLFCAFIKAYNSGCYAFVPLSTTTSTLRLASIGQCKHRGNTQSIGMPFVVVDYTNHELNNRNHMKLSYLKGMAKNNEKDVKNDVVKATVKGVTKSIHTALVTVVFFFFAFFAVPNPSMATESGGRMGGGSFSRSSYSSPAPMTRSYSSPRYSGSYGYSRPNVIVTSPTYYSPSPFGFWGAPGGGVIVSRGPSIFDVFFFGFTAFVLLNIFTGNNSGGGSLLSSKSTPKIESSLGTGIGVCQLSVALEVPNRDDPRSILSILERLSRTARTDSRLGVQNLVSQVALEILRQKPSIIAGSSRYRHFEDPTKAQREFNDWTVRERGKFEKETVNVYGGVDLSNSRSDRSSSFAKATCVVVTLILAIEGDSTKLNKISQMRDIENSLAKIASDAKVDDCLRSAEILWTPEDPGEILTRREVYQDYPELNNV